MGWQLVEQCHVDFDQYWHNECGILQNLPVYYDLKSSAHAGFAVGSFGFSNPSIRKKRSYHIDSFQNLFTQLERGNVRPSSIDSYIYNATQLNWLLYCVGLQVCFVAG